MYITPYAGTDERFCVLTSRPSSPGVLKSRTKDVDPKMVSSVAAVAGVAIRTPPARADTMPIAAMPSAALGALLAVVMAHPDLKSGLAASSDGMQHRNPDDVHSRYPDT